MGIHRVLLSLGSNLGDRKVNLDQAIWRLERTGAKLLRISAVYETAPVGVEDQPSFLNLAAEIETGLSPLELLTATQAIERGLGRTPTFRWGPRVIDIDIILWEMEIINYPRLQVPHPRFRERAFVLKPLAEIAPDAVDPETGHTVAQLAGIAAGQAEVYETP